MLHSLRSVPAPASAPPDHQRQVDALWAAVKAEGPAQRPSIFKPAPPKPAPSEDPLDHRIVEELECVRRHLELLGGVLANDPILLHRHGQQLQSLDMVNQLLGHLGRVIGAGEKDLAVEQISLQDLKARLKRAPLRPIAAA